MITADLSAIPQHWLALRAAPAHAQHWFELARIYAAENLDWQAGYAARQALRCDASLKSQLLALDLGAFQDVAAGDALLGRASLPDAAARVARFAKQREDCPGDWLTCLYLARLWELIGAGVGGALTQGANLDIVAAIREASALEPLPGESLHWMGVWRLNAGDGAGAVSAFSGLLDIRPMRFGSMMYLGEALLRVGNNAAAEKAFARASLSNNPDFLANLAGRVYGHNYWQEAIDVLKKALSLRPDSVTLLLSLAKIQSEVYSLADCRDSLARVQAIDPDNAEARLLEAGLMGRMGDARGHLLTLQKSYEAGGDPLSRTASSIAMTLLYQDTLSPEEVADWHRRLCTPIEAAVGRGNDFEKTRDAARQRFLAEPTRRLRIGYVTGDIHRQHPVNIFMLPVLLRHDHERFAIHIYHTGNMHDEYTRQAKASADRWVECAAMDDNALRQTILEDGIDVLVDLAGHTASHRLGVFAMRAAPVQASFLGYPGSTGMKSIDWLIGDAVVTPQEHANLISEGIAQMPDCVWCWAPVDPYPLPKARASEAPVVFASFNNAMKLSPRTIALWSRVLQAVPGSRLLLKAPSLRDEAVRQRFATLFAAQGIGRDRIEFRGPNGLADMMQEYGDVDIGLDPTPYNGGTTTLQALWMGVPVVCLCGGNFVGRMGASFMHTLGEAAWVAEDENRYVAVAKNLAGNVRELRVGRERLRAKMLASRLCDIETYVKNFERLLQRMWTSYCDGGAARMLNANEALDDHGKSTKTKRQPRNSKK
ncbi:MAG: hypothetical protein ACKVQK_21670 [Burkholderiales bacterium]